jgi:sugar/nucleoside kinase (ribokinase family)
VPGGAANAAVNVRSLGGSLSVGRSAAIRRARDLARSFARTGVDARHVLPRRRSGTVVKTRVLAARANARASRSSASTAAPAALSAAAAGTLARPERAIATAIRSARACLLRLRLRRARARDARRAGAAGRPSADIPVVVDSRYALRSYRGASLLTPNEHEVRDAFHLPSLEVRGLVRAGEELRRRAAASAVWITRGSDGMLVLERGRKPVHVPIVGTSRRRGRHRSGRRRVRGRDARAGRGGVPGGGGGARDLRRVGRGHETRHRVGHAGRARGGDRREPWPSAARS